jgi:tRNA-Thr(GGU) m(6)t(6)A37 methyltransferase TsaA
MDGNELRQNEVAVALPEATDAALHFIGVIRTPWATRRDCPKRGDLEGPLCRLEVAEPWAAALDGIETSEGLQVLYWLHEARRDLVRQSPSRDGRTHGTFALRSPLRPNPIGSSLVRLVRRDGPVLEVRGLDCVDGTPLLDVRPEVCPFSGRAAG